MCMECRIWNMNVEYKILKIIQNINEFVCYLDLDMCVCVCVCARACGRVLCVCVLFMYC